MTENDDLINISLPDDYLIGLGNIVYSWSILETVLDLCLARLSRIDFYDSRSAIIFAHMSFPMKLDILASLCAHMLPANPYLSEYKSVLKQLREAAKIRNTTMHARWGIDVDTGEVKRAHIEARGELKSGVYPVSINDLSSAKAIIGKAAGGLLYMLTTRDTDEAQ